MCYIYIYTNTYHTFDIRNVYNDGVGKSEFLKSRLFSFLWHNKFNHDVLLVHCRLSPQCADKVAAIFDSFSLFCSTTAQGTVYRDHT